MSLYLPTSNLSSILFIAGVMGGVGLVLLLHDLLYHLGILRLHISEPFKVKGVRIHHAYIGLALILLSLLLRCLYG